MRQDRPAIGDQVHYIPAFGQCEPARIIDFGGFLTITTRRADGQLATQTRSWSWQVVRINAGGVTLSELPHYWDDDEDTTVERSWHRLAECRVAPAEGGQWPANHVP